MKKITTIILLLFCLFSNAQNAITVKHKYYTLVYDTVLKSPLISYYIQTTKHATCTKKIDRKSISSFKQDPNIDSKYQIACDSSYKYNGRFDKGHLSPYSAFYFDLDAAKESMYYTNTAPQYSFLNECAWRQLEQHILKIFAIKYDSIYVFTGCLYGTNLMRNIPIPDYYWKVIQYNNSTLCWITKNEVTKDCDYNRMIIDVDQLKKIILKYYPNLELNF